LRLMGGEDWKERERQIEGFDRKIMEKWKRVEEREKETKSFKRVKENETKREKSKTERKKKTENVRKRGEEK